MPINYQFTFQLLGEDFRMPEFNLDGFANEGVITNGLGAPIALGFLPDNRMLVLEKGGKIFIADPNSGQKSLYLDISGRINSAQERGLLDIAIPEDFDPNVPGKNQIYLFYTRAAGTNRAVIASFDHNEASGGLSSTASANSETILWTDTDPIDTCCHYGGGLDFGPDGKIWLTSSDKFNTSNVGEGGPDDDWTANLNNTSGKIIRINRDGSIPNGTDGWPANPYVDGVIDGPYPALAPNGQPFNPDPSIWAYGLRNPFRADWDAEYGNFYIGEVGGNQAISTDDLHIASLDQAGAFYGWNFYEGVNNTVVYGKNAKFNPNDFPQPDTDLADPANGDYFSAPIYDIPHSSLTGGFVYRGSMFPSEFDGVYFFGNYEDGYIRFLDLDATGKVVEGVYDFKPSGNIPGATTNIVFLEEGKDGALYYVNYSANGGQVQRIVYQGTFAPEIVAANITDNQGDPNDGQGATVPFTVSLAATAIDSDTPLSDLTYTINFGDGTVINGAPDPTTGDISVDHTYTAEGFYTATLSVSDGTRSTLSQPFSITAGDPNDPPEFQSVASDIGFSDPGDPVTFTATVVDADVDDPAESLTYVLDFGDGSPVVTGNPNPDGTISVTHTYTDDGIYNAFFTISDGEAAPVSSDNIPVRVGASSQLPVTNGLVFQVESFIKIGTNGTTVTEWLDQSGFGNNLQAAGDPQLVNNATPSGQDAIVLDGTGDYLFREATAGTPLQGLSAGNAPRTMFFVVDYEDVTNDEFAGLVYGNDAQNQAFGLTLDGNEDDLAIQGWGSSHDRTTDIDGVINPANGQQRGFISHAVVFDGTTYKHYLNGVEIASGTKIYNTVVDKLLIGQNLNGGETPMSVAAAYIYDRALTPNEFNAVENYIQQNFLTAPGGNQTPDAVDDRYITTSGQTLTIPLANGLLNNDTDDGTLTVTEINSQGIADGDTVSLAHGSLTMSANGAFTYTANAGFTGAETFTYTVSDGTLTDTATVRITVTDPSSSNVPVTDGLVTQLESDLNVIVENGIVTEWLSVAGTQMDLVSTGDPVLVQNATPSGQSAISLDGGLAAFGEEGVAEGDTLQRLSPGQSLPDLPSGNAPRSMYFVVDYKAANGVSAGVAYGKGSKNNTFGLVVDKSNSLSVQGWGKGNDFPAPGQNGIGNNDGSAGDDWFVHSVIYDGTTIRHYRDNQLIDTDNHQFSTIVEKFIIGGETNNLGFSALDVGAVLVYDRALSTAEHDQTVQYLTQKYLTEPAEVDLIIDDGDTSFTATSTGTMPWKVGGLAGGFNGDYLYNAKGSGADVAQWNFTGLEAGTYEIAATWVAHPNRATDAPFTITGGASPFTVDVNQEAAPDDYMDSGVSWESLGTVTITGDTLSVSLSDDANKVVIADAIQLNYLGLT